MSVWENLGGIRGKVAAVLIAVFAAGGGTGYFAGRWHALEESVGRESARLATFRQPRQSRRKVSDRFMRRLESDLQLQSAQAEKIRAALSQQHERMMGLRMEMRPHVEKILEEARREIRTMLNPEQQRNFDQILHEFDERRRRWRSRFKKEHMMGGMQPGKEHMMGGMQPGKERMMGGMGPGGR